MSYAALPILRTPRLTLRPLTHHDADAIIRGVGNFDVSKWLGVVPYPYGTEDAASFLDETFKGNKPVWGICDTSGLVGTISVDNELGYWLARPAWRKGYGFEAAHGVVAHWFADQKAGTLTSGHFHGNDRSRAVLLALGFVDEAIRTRAAKSLSQDVTSFEMTLSRANWEARQKFTVETARLRLRPMQDSDVDALIDLARPEVVRMLFSLKSNLSRREAQAFIGARRWQGLPGFALAVERERQMIGYIATGASQGVELYYALHPDHWGQGLMSEATYAFVPELFRRFPINRIKADRFTDNPASGRVLEKLGFEVTGKEMGHSAGRVEPSPVITYALSRDKVEDTK